MRAAFPSHSGELDLTSFLVAGIWRTKYRSTRLGKETAANNTLDFRSTRNKVESRSFAAVLQQRALARANRLGGLALGLAFSE